jgi:hypothetical protein
LVVGGSIRQTDRSGATREALHNIFTLRPRFNHPIAYWRRDYGRRLREKLVHKWSDLGKGTEQLVGRSGANGVALFSIWRRLAPVGVVRAPKLAALMRSATVQA